MKTTTKRTQSRALPWFGSDATVSERYAALLADCKHVTVPFCGGLSIASHLVETASEIVCNDLHLLAINFYRIISNAATRQTLVNDLECVPFHESVLAESQEVCKTIGQQGWNCLTPREVAFHYFITCWMGRSGKAGTDAEFNGGLAMRGDAGGGSSPLRFQTAVRSIQEVWGPICERCSFVCLDWRYVLAKVKDDPQNGIYADPPFPDAGDGYLHKFTKADHRRLAATLSEFKSTRVVCRFYQHDLIEELYPRNDWRWIEVVGRKQTNADAPERIIVNHLERDLI